MRGGEASGGGKESGGDLNRDLGRGTVAVPTGAVPTSRGSNWLIEGSGGSRE